MPPSAPGLEGTGRVAADPRQTRRRRGAARPVLDLRAAESERRGLPADLVPQPAKGRARRGGAADATGACDGAAERVAREARLASDAVPSESEGHRSGRGDPAEYKVAAWITVEVTERITEKYRQEKRGRPGKETRYVEGGGHAFRPAARDRPGAFDRGSAMRRDLSADHERAVVVGAATAAGLQATAGDRASVRADEDGLRGGAGVLEGNESNPGVALCVLLRAADGVAPGAGVAPRDGRRRRSRVCRYTRKVAPAAGRRPAG